MVHIEHFTVNAFMERCSIVWDEEGNCAFVDPGCGNEKELAEVTSFVKQKGLKPVCIMLTHGHFDHVLGVAELAAAYGGLPVYMNPADKVTVDSNSYFSRMFNVDEPAPFMTSDIAEGSIIEVGNLRFEVLETPGHTPGGVSYLERNEKILFSGDTLFAGSIGRTDLPGGDYDALMKSIFEKLIILDGDVKVIPGHGPASEIAQERTTNPFLQPFNEPYDN